MMVFRARNGRYQCDMMHLSSVQQDLYTIRRSQLTRILALSFAIGVMPFSSSALGSSLANLSPQNDGDGDAIANTVDIDDDNDGIPDLYEIAEDGSDIDTDGDGMPDRLDLDSDNDGILDWIESGATTTLDLSSLRKVGGRLVGEVGHNGLLDVFETFVDSGELVYGLANSDDPADTVPDFMDLDSDNDGWPDLREAGVPADFDVDNNARLDARGYGVGNDGIYDYLQSVNDQACCDLNGDGIDDVMPLNTDGADLPDFQDLDSDNDGISDIAEFGGQDTDEDGRVDNFRDVDGGPDGLDDGALAFPYQTSDDNGNGVPDHIDSTNGGVGDTSGQPLTTVPIDDEPVGLVLTGLDASGCSIAGPSNGQHWYWLLLLIGAVGRLYFLPSQQRVKHVGR